MEKNVYAVKDPTDGSWYYYFTSSYNATFYADGAPMEKVDATGSSMAWWRSPHKAAQITRLADPHDRTVGYDLRPNISPTDKYPATLTAADMVGLDDDGCLDAYYDAVTEHVVPEPEVVETPVLELEGSPPACPKGLRYTATLPSALRERNEYVHLFPGHLTGVWNTLRRELTGRDYSDGNGWTVYVHDKWHATVKLVIEGKVEKQKIGRKVKSVPAWRGVEPDLPAPPARIAANSMAEALAKYQAIRDQWVGFSANLAICPTCEGGGTIVTNQATETAP